MSVNTKHALGRANAVWTTVHKDGKNYTVMAHIVGEHLAVAVDHMIEHMDDGHVAFEQQGPLFIEVMKQL